MNTTPSPENTWNQKQPEYGVSPMMAALPKLREYNRIKLEELQRPMVVEQLLPCPRIDLRPGVIQWVYKDALWFWEVPTWQ